MTPLDSKQSAMRDRQVTKRCNRCTWTKPVGDFSTCKGRLRSICKSCDAIAGKAYRDRCKADRAAYQANRATLPQDAPDERATTDSTPTHPASPSRPSVAAGATSEPDDKFAHLRRVPECKCTSNRISPSCEVHWAYS